MKPSGIDPATFRFVAQCLNQCATAVGQAESRRMHCSLPRLIVLTPPFGLPVHHQRRSTSDGMRDLYQRKEKLWARNGRSYLA
jgi:hypothetical protein